MHCICLVSSSLHRITKNLIIQRASLRVATAQSPYDFDFFSNSTRKLELAGRYAEERALCRSIELYEERGSLLRGTSPITDYGNLFDASSKALTDAYDRCGVVTKEYAQTFYLGTQLMSQEKARAIWAIYVWCRRTDELVDGPNASKITPRALDRWEDRLEAIFEGRPYDALDAALTDTVSRFPLDIQPFRDMIGGMRMDLVKSRYETFDELYEYCYRVAGTVGLMSTPVMGIDPCNTGPLEPVFKAALALGTANQLTNILRDVGEDAQHRDRIYLPLDELEHFGISDQEVLVGVHIPSCGKIDDRWQAFMRFQIHRAREYFMEAEAGVGGLDVSARWPVWSALILYRKILDSIEANGADNFSRRAYVSKFKKISALPNAYLRAMKLTNQT